MSVYVSNTFPNKSELDSILNDSDAIINTVLSLKNQQVSLLDQQIKVCNKILELCTVADTKDIEKSLRKINYYRFDAIKAFAVLGVNN
jgi:type IV secretory pathway protease TraF